MNNKDISNSSTVYGTALPIVLPSLPYAENALEPVISAKTMGFHYGKHHKGYVDNLNKLITGIEYADLSLETIITSTAGQPERIAIFNNAAQTWNHTFYWKSMTPKGGGEPPAALKQRIGHPLLASTPARRSLPAQPFHSSGVVRPGLSSMAAC